MNPYVYVVVRLDLSVPQQAVQSAHAVLEMHRQFNGVLKEHPSIIILGVKNEQKLKNVIGKLVQHNKFRFTTFQEPDIGNQFTALATEPLYGEDRKFFKEFKLIDGFSSAPKKT